MNVYFYGPHTSGLRPTHYRWWQKGHPGDAFDVITKAELDERIAAAKLLNHEVIDHLPAFCDDEACPDCIKHGVK